MPDDIQFKTKPQIALGQIRETLAAGVSLGVVVSDAGHENDMRFRSGLKEMNLDYVVAVQSSISLWPPGQEPLPPKPLSGKGHPASHCAPRSGLLALVRQGVGAEYSSRGLARHLVARGNQC